MPSTQQLLWPAAWSALGGPFISFCPTIGCRKCSCRGSISGNVGSFQSGQAFAGQTALAVQSLLLSGCDKGHKPAQNG